MPSHYLSYWKPATADHNLQFKEKLAHCASEQYEKLEPDDTLWIVTAREGRLQLLGRLVVGRVVSQKAAGRKSKPGELWAANWHALSKPGTEQPLRQVDVSELARKLTFESISGRTHLEVVNGKVNPQQLQRVRKLNPASAALLAQALGVSEGVTTKEGNSVTPAPTTPPTKPKSTTPAATKSAKPPKSRSQTSPQLAEIKAALAQLQAAGKKSPDLIKKEYRGFEQTEIPLNGLCYVLCECMYHLFPESLSSYHINWEDGRTHWFLRFPSGKILDPIAKGGKECCSPEEYELGRRSAFLTKNPSKRAVMLLERAGYELIV